MSFLLSRQHLRTLRYARRLGIWYVNNPKVGCSTVKRSLWTLEDHRNGVVTFAGNPHNIKDMPFLGIEPLLQDLSTGTGPIGFSMVRNPYVRALSAYLSKIRTHDDGIIRPKFDRRFGLTDQKPITFLDFLRLMTFEAPECQDPHFAPQVVNLAWPYLSLSRIYHLENSAALYDWLATLGAEQVSSRPENPLHARDKLETFYCDESVALVRQLYDADFAAFGYSPDFADAVNGSTAPIERFQNFGLLLAMLRVFNARPFLRTVANLTRMEESLEDLKALAGRHAPPEWFDYLRLRLFGLEEADSLERLDRLIEAAGQNHLLLTELAQMVQRSNLPKYAALIAARKSAVLRAHRATMPELSYMVAA